MVKLWLQNGYNGYGYNGYNHNRQNGYNGYRMVILWLIMVELWLFGQKNLAENWYLMKEKA